MEEGAGLLYNLEDLSVSPATLERSKGKRKFARLSSTPAISGRAEINGTNLYYERRGKLIGQAPVLFLHHGIHQWLLFHYPCPFES